MFRLFKKKKEVKDINEEKIIVYKKELEDYRKELEILQNSLIYNIKTNTTEDVITSSLIITIIYNPMSKEEADSIINSIKEQFSILNVNIFVFFAPSLEKAPRIQSIINTWNKDEK